MSEEKIVGRINMTAVGQHVDCLRAGTLPYPDVDFTTEIIEKLANERTILMREIHRLREALTVISSVADANIMLSKEKLGDK